MSPQTVPVYINDTATDFTKIVSGRRHNCALKQGGTVKCWGEGGYGQMGNNQTGNQVSPVSVTGLSNATNITSLEYHTCVILNDQSAKCWGHGGYWRSVSYTHLTLPTNREV